jgi:hypothetical protein
VEFEGQTTLLQRGLADFRVRDRLRNSFLVFRFSSCSEAFSSVSRRPFGCHPSNSPPIPFRFIMLRTTLRQCSRQLQSCSAKARLSTIAASPARTNAISTCRRPLAVAQRRHYALAAEDTDKGVVRG